MLMNALRLLRISLFLAAPSVGQLTVVPTDDDLEVYISRPDIRSSKFTVLRQAENSAASGYWLVAPYADLINRQPTRLHQSHQIGPHIYDQNGDLVWSGAGIFPGRNVFDFKISEHEGGSRLSFLLQANEHDDEHVAGAGVIMDNNYQVEHFVKMDKGVGLTNMHEFTLTEGGKTALMFMHQARLFESTAPAYHAWTLDLGFTEVDIETGKTLFEWWSLDHVHPLQSTVYAPNHRGDSNRAWDYFHINSIDKDRHGNYLISARHCNSIYKINGLDGSIMWQLGGKNSSFDQRDFSFSSQHDARFIESNDTRTVISFLNNGSDGVQNTTDISSAMIVALDTSTKPMSAKLLRKYDRPDGRQSQLRGNVQILQNSNVFVGWSENSYMTEFTEEGEVVLEAHFQSTRFATYRSFKFNFTGAPLDRPDLVCGSYGTIDSPATTACYVSWNGATEVRSWNFWSVLPDGHFMLLGNAPKVGFETAFMSSGCATIVFAEALDAGGLSMRNSSAFVTRDTTGYDCRQTSAGKFEGKPPASPINSFFEETERVPIWWLMICCTFIGACGMFFALHAHRIFRFSRTLRTVEKRFQAV